jgi:NDP-sugar pyrophosphorylase family protein
MVEVANRPIVDYQLDWLASYGVEHVVLSCGYKADVLREHLAGRNLPVAVTVLVEDEPLGRGGGLKYAASGLPGQDQRYFALNGDVLTWFDLGALTEYHLARGVLGTLALAQYRTSWGIVEVDEDGLIGGFTQSPLLPFWINAGVYLFEPGFTALLPDKGDHEDSTLPELAHARKLAGYRIDGYWRGVDTVKDVKEASEQIPAVMLAAASQ